MKSSTENTGNIRKRYFYKLTYLHIYKC